jgi:hypothetical protein
MAARVEDAVKLAGTAKELLEGSGVLPQGLLGLKEGGCDDVVLGEVD